MTAVLQLIYELRKNCCGWTGGRTETSKVLQEVLADLKIESVSVGSNACPTQADVLTEDKMEEKKEYISKHRLGHMGR